MEGDIEKVLPVLWKTYVVKLAERKRDASSSLDEVKKKIAQIITIAEVNGNPTMLAKWEKVRTEIMGAVVEGRQASYSIKSLFGQHRDD